MLCQGEQYISFWYSLYPSVSDAQYRSFFWAVFSCWTLLPLTHLEPGCWLGFGLVSSWVCASSLGGLVVKIYQGSEEDRRCRRSAELPWWNTTDGGLDNRCWFSHSFGGCKSKIKVMAGGCWTKLSPWLVDSHLLIVSSHDPSSMSLPLLWGHLSSRIRASLF